MRERQIKNYKEALERLTGLFVVGLLVGLREVGLLVGRRVDPGSFRDTFIVLPSS